MSSDLVVLLATGLVALVALLAAIVTVRAARQVARDRAALAALVERAGARATSGPPGPEVESAALVPMPFVPGDAHALVLRQEPDGVEPVTRVVDGKVFVVPTSTELVATALSRPGTRFTVAIHGLAHALRPESRDRISALMRREVTRRRRERQRAARRAARAHVPTANPGTAWVTPSEAER